MVDCKIDLVNVFCRTLDLEGDIHGKDIIDIDITMNRFKIDTFDIRLKNDLFIKIEPIIDVVLPYIPNKKMVIEFGRKVLEHYGMDITKYKHDLKTELTEYLNSKRLDVLNLNGIKINDANTIHVFDIKGMYLDKDNDAIRFDLGEKGFVSGTTFNNRMSSLFMDEEFEHDLKNQLDNFLTSVKKQNVIQELIRLYISDSPATDVRDTYSKCIFDCITVKIMEKLKNLPEQ